MNIFIDAEAMRFVTEKELRQEFEQLKREQPEEYDYQQIVEYVLELLLGTYGAVESLWCSGME